MRNAILGKQVGFSSQKRDSASLRVRPASRLIVLRAAATLVAMTWSVRATDAAVAVKESQRPTVSSRIAFASGIGGGTTREACKVPPSPAQESEPGPSYRDWCDVPIRGQMMPSCPSEPAYWVAPGGIYKIPPEPMADPEPQPMIICGVSYGNREDPVCAAVPASSTPPSTNGPQGFNWFQMSRPEIQLDFNSGNETGTPHQDDRIYLYLSNTKVAEFERVRINSTTLSTTTFAGINGNTAIMTYTAKVGTNLASTFEIQDVSGDKYTFFGFDVDASAAGAAGQLWKAKAPDGSESYISNASGTVTIASGVAGFVQSGSVATNRPQTVYDTAGQRRTYTYTSSAVGGRIRYASITIARFDGTNWNDISKEEYSYYGTGMTHGLAGDLKKIVTTVYLSSTGSPVTLAKTRYYRYYTSNGSNGGLHQLRLSLDAEGCRRYLQDNPTKTIDDLDTDSAITDSVLLPYASAYLEYYDDNAGSSSFKVKKLVTNANCSCGSGSAQTYEYSYSVNASYTGSDAGYDADGDWSWQKWARRQVIKYPDGMYKTIYVDEYDRTLAEVTSNDNPTNSSTFHWVTKYLRDTNSRITAIASPEAITAYDHAGSNPGTITLSTTDGLVTYRTYHLSFNGDAVTKEAHSEGYKSTPSDRTLDREFEYETSTSNKWKLTVGDGDIRKPYPVKVWAFKTEVAVGTSPTTTNSDETVFVYDFWNGSEPWQVKSVETRLPYVVTANNGAGTSGSPDNAPLANTKRYFDQGGRLVFTETDDGRFNYMEYDSRGQMTRSIQDVQANGSDTPLAAAATAHSITLPGSATNLITTTTYDDQGRPSTTTIPTGRIMAMFYSKLSDGRFATLSVPRRTGTSTFTYYGPVSYSITNQAGRSEGSGILTLAGSSNDAQSIASWIDTTKSDPIQAIVGTYASVARFSATTYNKAGTIMEESRAYHTLSTTLAGSSADVTKVAHDNRGRVIRTEDPTGTISRTDFDKIGRPVARWIGTNDSTFSGSPFGSGDNMTKVETRVYDSITNYSSGGLGKNSRLTRRSSDEDGDWSTTTGDQRHTDFIYDYRGRLIVQTNPVAPHAVFKYDNRGRRIAAGTYSTTSGFTSSKDPTASTSSDRLSLSETSYDERGQVWKSVQRKITQSSGGISSGGELETLNWYDYNGRLVKTISPSGLQKMVYDRLDRVERTYTLASTNDSAYADADDVTGDIVLEETVTNYNNASGNVLASYTISRDPGMSTSTTGALDTGTNGTDVLVDTELAGDARPQITAMFYDDWDRPIATVQYGTYGMDAGSATFTRSSITTVPSRSSTVLVSETTYTKDGLPEIAADPLNQKTKYSYDKAGRRILTIINYNSSVNSGMPSGASNNFVRNEYTNGLQTKLWVDLDGDNTQDTGDQVTLYTYGVTKGTLGSGSPVQSQLASNRLLRQTSYPDSSGGSDVVTHAYNALGEQVWTKDQHGTIIKTTMDTGGRQTARIADTLGTNIDGAVRRIELSYTNRGQPYEVTQYNATTSGSVVNQVKYTYDDYGYTEQMDQDFDSAVGASGAAHRTVTFSNTRVAPSNGRTSVRRTAIGLADGASIGYTFSSSSSLDDVTGRVTSVTLTPSGGSPTTLAEYEYLGRANLVTTELNPGWISTVRGTSAGSFSGLDRFNRIIVSKWTDGVSDRQRFNITYDENSNILGVEDPILDNYTGSGYAKTFSLGLTMDGRNRITEAKRGLMSGGSITGTARMDQIWSLDQVGNWDNVKTDLNGDSDGTDAGELNDTRTYNTANELLTRSAPSSTQTHDAAGQMTFDGQDHIFRYDAFGRLVKVLRNSVPIGTSGIRAEYKYDGLGQRIGWHCDLNADDDVTTADPWMWFIYDDRWRIVNTYRLAYSGGNWNVDSSAKERFIHHAAGIDGKGGSSYIDAVILSDRDLTNGWSGAADGTIESRLYHLQNWRNDLCAVADGYVIARHYRYSAYGTRTEVDGADYNRDGFTDFFDSLDFNADHGTSAARADFNNDGTVDNFDSADFVDSFNITSDDSPHSAPRGLYAGYEHDPALEYQGALSGGGAGIYTIESYAHVRHRVYSTELGRWTRRDPLGYHDGDNLYAYCNAQSVDLLDASGLWGASGHFYTVFLAASCAGRPPGEAMFMAYYAQYPDQVDDLDAKSLYFYYFAHPSTEAFNRMMLVHQTLHALTGGNTEKLRACLLSLLASGELTPVQRALLLHTIGDAWAHSKPNGKQYPPGHGHGPESLTPKLVDPRTSPLAPWFPLTPDGIYRYGSPMRCGVGNCCPDNISNNRVGYNEYFITLCMALGGDSISCSLCAIDADAAMFGAGGGDVFVPADELTKSIREHAERKGLPGSYRPGDKNTSPWLPAPKEDDVNELMQIIRRKCKL